MVTSFTKHEMQTLISAIEKSVREQVPHSTKNRNKKRHQLTLIALKNLCAELKIPQPFNHPEISDLKKLMRSRASDANTLLPPKPKRVPRNTEVVKRLQEDPLRIIGRKSGNKPKHKKRRKYVPTSMSPSFIASKQFLLTYEWRKLRLQALEKYDRRCQCCGAGPQDAHLHVDHIKPRKHFPELALVLDNLQILCEDCNHGKGNWCQTDFRSSSHCLSSF